GECRLARVLEDEIDIIALAGDVPDRLAEVANLLEPGVILRRADLRHFAPAVEVLAVDDALGAELHDEVTLVVVRYDADRVGSRRGTELNGHGAEPTRGTPHEDIVPGPQDIGAMAEQHAIGRGESQRVAGAFLPGQVPRALHQLAVLHPGELGERAIRRLVAPDPLRRREHGIAAVALLVVAIVLVAVDDHLVADLPALDLGAHGPNDARRIRAGDVVRVLVHIER